MNKILRICLWILLLGVGFFVGTAWNNDTTTQQKQAISADPSPIKEFEEKETVQEDKLTSSEKSLIRLFENAAPSVVFITTSKVKRDFWTRNVYEIPSGTGSGFIWDKEGHIVTNFHVIEGASRAEVTLSDQSIWPATLVGKAPEKDLAVLKIEAPLEKLNPIPVGSSDNLKVGQSVLAIGNPFGLDQTLTTGIISALGREINSGAGIPIRNVIQTDAAINPGNSGGPLLNSSGKLIGVNTAIYSPSGAYAGIGFSIPSDVVNWVVPDLIENGFVKRPTLGVELASSNLVDRMGLKGALIIDIVPGTGAEKAGLKGTFRNSDGKIELGDLIVGINDTDISSRNDLILALEEFKIGEVVMVKIIREGNEDSVEVELGGS